MPTRELANKQPDDDSVDAGDKKKKEEGEFLMNSRKADFSSDFFC